MDSKLYYNYCCIYKYDLGAGGGVAAARHRAGEREGGQRDREGRMSEGKKGQMGGIGIAQLRTVSCLLVT